MSNRRLPLALVLATAAHAQGDASLAVGRVVRFELEDTAPRFAAPGLAKWIESAPGKRFTFTPDAAGVHTIDLKSALCDSYLILRTPDGKVVAETGFGPYGEHARLEFEFEPGVEYLVDACSFEGFGTLRIAVHAGKIAQPQGAAWAQEVLGDATATLAARRRALGDDDERVLAAYSDLGHASWQFGLYRKALAAYEAILEILERRDQPGGMRIPFAYEQIAEQHFELGEIDDAEAAYRKALSLYEAAGKPAAAAQALSGISRVLKTRGDFAEALELDRRALDILTREPGGDSSLVAIAHNNVASSLHQLGRTDEAQHHYEAARNLFRDLPDTALQRCQCDRNLASLLANAGRVCAASALLDEVAHRFVDEVGWYHPAAFPMARDAAFYRLRAGYATEARALATAAIAALSDGRARAARVSMVEMEGLAECLAGTELGAEQERMLDARARRSATAAGAGIGSTEWHWETSRKRLRRVPASSPGSCPRATPCSRVSQSRSTPCLRAGWSRCWETSESRSSTHPSDSPRPGSRPGEPGPSRRS